ncbi:hypothetical protein Pla108_07660 [Botrimarina colliarenosi]|uniref:MotA/TolQ/ExbB proton channel domain-containing protein n=1 Tax=Botrimarina colliarenosi TaxID=2528001 RepID=A0A5C6ANT5_9BACT|nr:MotA/TolQ/ExbB proton channel family protein [Botrimarina colliarenosi]TWT99823.1 hypothetical protein Pla108_07660 [Botrimarina colliarenosi]
MDPLAQLVYELATAMLAPVLVALVAMFGWALFAFGAFLSEWRWRCRGADWTASLAPPGNKTPDRPQRGLRGEAAASLRSGVTEAKALTDLELAASGRLAWMSFGVRTGPLLGLMGTLIPMGPALVGLSAGDIEALAGNLVIVFSTTVIGVFIGGLCYTLLLIRRQWYASDLADVELAVAAWQEGASRAEAVTAQRAWENSHG